MARWLYLLLGGDWKSPHFRRFAFRLLIYVSMFIGTSQAVLLAYDGPHTAALLFAIRIGFVVSAGYETFLFYRRSDELLRSLIDKCLALSAVVLLLAAFVYHAATLYLGFPQPSMRLVIIAIAVVVSTTWWSVAPRHL